MTEPQSKGNERDADLDQLAERADKAYKKLQRIRSMRTTTERGAMEDLTEEEKRDLSGYVFGMLDRWHRSNNLPVESSVRQQATDFLFKELGDPPNVETPIVRRMQKVAEKYRTRSPEPPSKIIQLPLWPEGAPGMPNALIRSALFPPIKSKDRQWLKREKIASLNGVEIIFSGQQFNQQDFDVALTVFNIARKDPLGTVCHTSAQGLLKKLQWAIGKEQHDQLHETLVRLTNTFEVKGDRYDFFGSIIFDGIRDKVKREYTITVNPKVGSLFDGGWTRIEMETRRKLRGKDLAQWLQNQYVSHHPHILPYSVDFLRKLSGSRTKELKHFRAALRRALDELERVGVIAPGWEIDSSDKVHVHKVPTIKR